MAKLLVVPRGQRIVNRERQIKKAVMRKYGITGKRLRALQRRAKRAKSEAELRQLGIGHQHV